MFSTAARRAGDDRPIRVVASERRRMGTGTGRGFGPGSMNAPKGGAGRRQFPPAGMSIVTQVQLRDGTWATFETQVTTASATLPWRVLVTLAILLVAVLVLSYLAVRWVTRPLHVLASAADELGRDINRPPLPEEGPAEVSRAAHAFNTMQSRLIRLIDDRTRILAAMSHDLKTPITRMRLRADLLDDDELRAKFEADLREMEAMVTATLEFMRGLGKRDAAQPLDTMALLESLQAENEDMGRAVTLAGRVSKPYVGSPSLLKRCIANLIDNALNYGGRADITVADEPNGLIIRIRDHGAGIPDNQLEAVFEPFFASRVTQPRDRGTGGIVHCARHRADPRRRCPTAQPCARRIEAILTLPRTQASGVTSVAISAGYGLHSRSISRQTRLVLPKRR
jgi:signal transduction histidine kinase